jgi:hypothetical protein
MFKVHTSFENCYGIKKLNYVFDFSEKSIYAVYSPNGTMKTSFAKAFMDFSKNSKSSDLVFPDRNTVRSIKSEDGNDLDSEQIFVIEPYNQEYKSEKLSTLLVNSDLKAKYDAIHGSIDERKVILLNELNPLSGLKKGIDKSFSLAFTHSENEFYKALVRVKEEVLDEEEPLFDDISYTSVFSDKVVTFIGTKDFKEKISEYIEKYDELIDSSTYFKRGVFNHNNASVVAKNLKDNGFFEAKHSVSLNSGGEKKEISTQKELEEVITQEKDAILNNPDLTKAFDALDSKLKANKELRDFRDYLLENKKILPELENLDLFKQKLWISYLKATKESYVNLELEYSKGKEEIEVIIKEAKREETGWRNVIDIFNKRFSVPFRLSVDNQEDVILKSDGPSIKFTFEDSEGSKPINESDLLRVLSNGEKRALYILNIIFEVEARKSKRQKTLFIVDDIADSFDYKNKYAIVEYLKDISMFSDFYQILLTHNFDFYRTICGRLDMRREHKLHTIKNDDEVILVQEKYQNSPFQHWKNHLNSNKAMLIASIPFVRNIAEYSDDTESFNKLTSLLHIKNDTDSISVADLECIHKGILKNHANLDLPDKDHIVLDIIFEEANRITGEEGEQIDLEGKIVLAIAIRLKAEEYMIASINNPVFVNSITSNQTFKLYSKYIEMSLGDRLKLEILAQVNLMTPENIHINSFMYEPILDMSNLTLVNLYENVKNTLL